MRQVDVVAVSTGGIEPRSSCVGFKKAYPGGGRSAHYCRLHHDRNTNNHVNNNNNTNNNNNNKRASMTAREKKHWSRRALRRKCSNRDRDTAAAFSLLVGRPHALSLLGGGQYFSDALY